MTANETKHGTDRLVDNDAAAEFLGVKPSTLPNWRCTKRVNIPFVRVGRAIRYRVSDLEAFIAKNTEGAGISE